MTFRKYLITSISILLLSITSVFSEPDLKNQNRVIMPDFEIQKGYALAGYLKLKNNVIELIPGLDGVGRASWILKLKNQSLLIVSFEWGVRPRIKAIATNATLIGLDRSEIVPVLLEHTGYAKDGKLYPLLKGKIIDSAIDLNPKTSWTHVNDSELIRLLANYSYSLKVVTP